MSLSIKLFGNRYYLKTHQALWFTITTDKEISVLPVNIELSVFLGHFSLGTNFIKNIPNFIKKDIPMML